MKTVITKPGYVIKESVHRVAGVTHYMDAIMDVAEENAGYYSTKKELIEYYPDGTREYQYYFPSLTTELVEEPDNAHDPNAIKVIVGGKHVGYIKSGSCARVRNIIRSGKINNMTADLVGGKCKILYCDYDDELEKYVYHVEHDKSNLGIVLTIYVKEERESEEYPALSGAEMPDVVDSHMQGEPSVIVQPNLGNPKHSAKTYKVARIVLYLLSVCIVLLGLPLLFAVPPVGIVFIILAVFLFFVARGYSKIIKNRAATHTDPWDAVEEAEPDEIDRQMLHEMLNDPDCNDFT